MEKQYIDPQPKPPTYENSLQKTHVPSVGSQHIPIGGSDPQFSLPVKNDDWLSNRDLSQYKMGPAIQPLVGSIRYDHLKGANRNWIPKAREIINRGVAGKIDMFTEVSRYDTHDRVGADTWVPKFSSYKVGVNNEERLALGQSSMEKFINPIVRGNIKVTRGGVLDLLALPYGITAAANTGRLESVYDNDFTNWIDKLDADTDHKYRNYYTEADKNLGFNTYTWDSTLGGAEFTGRMLASEGLLAALTFGGSLPASFAKWGLKGTAAASKAISAASKAGRAANAAGHAIEAAGRAARLGGEAAANVARVANKADEVLSLGRQAAQTLRIATEPIRNVAAKGGAITTAAEFSTAIDRANRLGKYGKTLSDLRFALSSSAYEAGFEARHYKNQAEREFWEYHRMNGTEPTQDELYKFYDKLDTTSWTVYGANMAILGASNVAMYGKMFNVGNPFSLGLTSYLEKNLLKLGTQKGANGVWEAMKPSVMRKALGYATHVGKGFATEGVFEEGMQGVASGMASNYIKATYDPKYARSTADWASAFTKAFHDQFSTKHGIEEVVIGGIIGGLFGVGGAVNMAKQYKNQAHVAEVQNAIENYAKDLSTNLYTNTHLAAMMAHGNRLQYLADAYEKGVDSKTLSESMNSIQHFVSMLEASHNVGKGDFFMETLKSTVAGMNAESIANNFGIDISKVEDFKADKINGMQRIADSYDKARQTAEYLFGQGHNSGVAKVAEEMGIPVTPGLQNRMIDTFAYVATMSDMSQQFAKDSYEAVQSKLIDMQVPAEIRDQFKGIAGINLMSRKVQGEYVKLSDEIDSLKKEKEVLLDELDQLQQGERSPEKAKRIAEIAKELQAKEVQLEELRDKRSLLFKSATNNFFNEDEGVGRTFENYNDFNKAIDSLVDDVLTNGSISENDRRELLELLTTFNESNNLYKSFANLARDMTSQEFSYKTFTGLFSKARANRLDVNDTTRNAYKELLQDFAKSYELVGEASKEYVDNHTEIISDEDIKNMEKDDYTPSPEQIDQLADKIKNNKTLGSNEQKFYDKFKTEVDEALVKKQQSESDPINDEEGAEEVTDYTPEITKMQQELDELEKGGVSDYIDDVLERMPDNVTNDVIDEVVARRKKYLKEKIERYQNGTVDPAVEEELSKLEELEDEHAIIPKEDTAAKKEAEKKVKNQRKKIENSVSKDDTYSPNADFKDKLKWIKDHFKKLGIKLSNKGERSVTNSIEEDIVWYLTFKAIGEENLTEDQKQAYQEIKENLENQKIGGKSFIEILGTSTEKKGKNKTKGLTPYPKNRSKREAKKWVTKVVDSLGISNLVSPEEINSIVEYLNYKTKDTKLTPEENDRYELAKAKLDDFQVGNRPLTGIIDDVLNGRAVDEVKDSITHSDSNVEIAQEIILDEGNKSKKTEKKAEEVTPEPFPKDTNKNVVEQWVRDLIDKLGLSHVVSDELSNDKIYIKNIVEYLRFKANEANLTDEEQFSFGFVKSILDDFQVGDRSISSILDAAFEGKTVTKVEETSTEDTEIPTELILNEDNNKSQEEESEIPTELILNETQEESQQEEEEESILDSFPANASFKERIDWINNNLDDLGLSEYIDDITNVEKPSEEEMQRYLDLKTKGIDNMDAAEKLEFTTLRDKVRAYKLVENSEFEGVPLLDMLDAIAEVTNAEEVKERQAKVEEEDIQESIATHDQNLNDLGFTERSPVVGLVYDGVFMSKNQLHHVKLETLARKAVEKGMSVVVRTFTGTKTEGDIKYVSETPIPSDKIGLVNNYEGANGVEISFVGESGKIVLRRSNSNATRGLHIEEGDVVSLLDARAYAIKGANHRYLQLYDKKSNGNYGPMEADFTVKNNGVTISFNNEAAANLKPGDEVYVKFEAADDYNRSLDKRDYATKGNMYIVDKNGKLVNVLKAASTERKNLGPGSVWSKLKAARKLATQKPIVPIKVAGTYLGYPKFQIDENNKPIKHIIDESKVLSYGFRDGKGEIVLFNSGIEVHNAQYVEAMKAGKTVPIVVFKYGSKNVAFPIDVSSETKDVSSELTDILSNDALNEAQKVIQLNTLMAKYGIDNEALRRKGGDISTADVAEIKEQLSNIEMPVDYKDQAAVERANKSIFIDMNDPFMASKIVLDYGNVEELVEQKKENKEAKKETPAKEGKEEAEKKTCKKKKK